MTTVAHLLQRARRYAQFTGYKPTTVSRKIFNDGKRLGFLEEHPSRITVDRLERADTTLTELEKEAGVPAEAEAPP